jgi:hypothetical protein
VFLETSANESRPPSRRSNIKEECDGMCVVPFMGRTQIARP